MSQIETLLSGTYSRYAKTSPPLYQTNKTAFGRALTLHRFSNMRFGIQILILLMLPLFQNCGKFASTEANSADSPALQTLASLDDRIKQNIRLSCTSTAECVVAPAGDRPCGGPSRYYVYSRSSTDSSLIERLINEFTLLEQSYNVSNNLIGTCEAIDAPTVSCDSNICIRQ